MADSARPDPGALYADKTIPQSDPMRRAVVASVASEADAGSTPESFLLAVATCTGVSDVSELHGLRAVFEADTEFAAAFTARAAAHVLKCAAQADELLARRAPPLLMAGSAGVVRLVRAQAYALICQMFLCIRPQPVPSHGPHDFPEPSFLELLCSPRPQEQAKLRCFLQYLFAGATTPLRGHIVVRRQRLAQRPTAEQWNTSARRLQELVLFNGLIDHALGAAQADFANAYIGGGVISGGCVQEEVLFAHCPECLVSLLLCQRMDDDEAIVITGAQRFSDTSGYARSLRCDRTPTWEDGTVKRAIVAFDAERYSLRGGLHAQTRRHAVVRDLNKALAAFAVPASAALAPDAVDYFPDAAHTGDAHLPSPVRAASGGQADDVADAEGEAAPVVDADADAQAAAAAAAGGGEAADGLPSLASPLFFEPNPLPDLECTPDDFPFVATGNWGCGAFGGDKDLKAVQQWLAASQAGRKLAYSRFGPDDDGLHARLRALLDAVAECERGGAEVTVGSLCQALVKAIHVLHKEPEHYDALITQALSRLPPDTPAMARSQHGAQPSALVLATAEILRARALE